MQFDVGIVVSSSCWVEVLAGSARRGQNFDGIVRIRLNFTRPDDIRCTHHNLIDALLDTRLILDFIR